MYEILNNFYIEFDKWQKNIEFMKQIPQRIINDVEEGWMRSIEVSERIIHFQNTNNFTLKQNSSFKIKLWFCSNIRFVEIKVEWYVADIEILMILTSNW